MVWANIYGFPQTGVDRISHTARRTSENRTETNSGACKNSVVRLQEKQRVAGSGTFLKLLVFFGQGALVSAVEPPPLATFAPMCGCCGGGWILLAWKPLFNLL